MSLFPKKVECPFKFLCVCSSLSGIVTLLHTFLYMINTFVLEPFESLLSSSSGLNHYTSIEVPGTMLSGFIRKFEIHVNFFKMKPSTPFFNANDIICNLKNYT